MNLMRKSVRSLCRPCALGLVANVLGCLGSTSTFPSKRHQPILRRLSERKRGQDTILIPENALRHPIYIYDGVRDMRSRRSTDRPRSDGHLRIRCLGKSLDVQPGAPGLDSETWEITALNPSSFSLQIL